MLSLFMIGSLAAALVSVDGPLLQSEWLYNPINAPVMIQVDSPESPAGLGRLKLALMDARGVLIVDPTPIRPGRLDLAEVLPDIRSLRQASYLQLMAEDVPVGSPLVVQPMLSRMVPVTEDAVSPSGFPYTRIIRWRDELDREEPDETSGDLQTEDQVEEAEPESPEEPTHADRLSTGWRIYTEQDVLLRTSEGDIVLAMSPDQAPNTAWNFLRLSEGGFYRGILFHRIVPLTRQGEPFVIQAGDPTALGNGGPGYWLPIEPSELPHDFGVISMARDPDPDSAGSQFFICLSREGTARLDGHYCAFGYAVDGRDTILSIADVELADVAAGKPVDAPVIESADLIPAPPRHPGIGRSDRRVRLEPKPSELTPEPATPDRVPR